MGVCAIRIDERLIHGQVATLWQGSWNCNRIMVIDTKSANDPMLKSVLKIACPTGVRLSVLEPDTAAANLQSGKYGKGTHHHRHQDPRQPAAAHRPGLPPGK